MVIFTEIYSNALAQQFKSLRQQPEISELLLDVLDFIEEKMLRMGPEKRATCKEFVEKFREIYQKASSDENYCLHPVQDHPKRVNTDLSTLSPHVFDTNECRGLNPQSSHHGVREGQSKSFLGSRTVKDRDLMDSCGIQSTSRMEGTDYRQRTLEVPRSQDSREKRRLDHSPSTNRSSSRSTNHAMAKLPLPADDGTERPAKRRGLRQKLRALRCW